MTYKLEPFVKHIITPIVLRFPDGNSKQYRNGAELSELNFSKPYRVKALEALTASENNEVEIEIILSEMPIRAESGAESSKAGDTEQTVSFF